MQKVHNFVFSEIHGNGILYILKTTIQAILTERCVDIIKIVGSNDNFFL